MGELATVTALDELGSRELAAFGVRGNRIAIARVGDAFYAFGDTCTHQGCSLADGELAGTTVTCPCHGSQFDATTGDVLRGPAGEPVRSYPVRLEDNALQVEVWQDGNVRHRRSETRPDKEAGDGAHGRSDGQRVLIGADRSSVRTMSVEPRERIVGLAIGDWAAIDIDGLLITTGGAGTRSWRWAFDELYGIPADIGEFTESGMTDPVVGRLTFTGVIGREPSTEELASVVSHYLMRLPEEVAQSSGYHVLEGVEELLLSLCRNGFLLGITTGAVEAAAHIKVARAGLNRFFSFGGYGSDSADRGELTRKAIDRAGVILGSPLDPPRVLVLGDTPKDVAAAHSANAIAVGVASGHYGEVELREAGADYVLGSLTEELPGIGEAAP